MLILHTKVGHTGHVDGEIVLSFTMRGASRLETVLPSGEEVAIRTPRGTVLRNGDLLKGDDGRVVRILAAKEATCRVECDTRRDLLRCAYHLGERHAQVHIGSIGDYGYLRIRPDPAMKEMLEELGATVIDEQAAFEPEMFADGMEHALRGDSEGEGAAHHFAPPASAHRSPPRMPGH